MSLGVCTEGGVAASLHHRARVSGPLLALSAALCCLGCSLLSEVPEKKGEWGEVVGGWARGKLVGWGGQERGNESLATWFSYAACGPTGAASHDR